MQLGNASINYEVRQLTVKCNREMQQLAVT